MLPEGVRVTLTLECTSLHTTLLRTESLRSHTCSYMCVDYLKVQWVFADSSLFERYPIIYCTS